MVGTIPADTLQFYAIALRLSQEIAYIYGAGDLWEGGEVDIEKVTNQLVLYCGVMFGVSGASATLKLMSSALSKQALAKLPQKALTKTLYYPIVKRIAMFFGTRMTKDVFAKGVSKVIPVVGGVVSGSITLATMRPMGMRLVDSFDDMHFDYTKEDYEHDIKEVESIIAAEIEDNFVEKSEDIVEEKIENYEESQYIVKIREAKTLLDDGVINDEEFEAIKGKIIAGI